MITSRQSDMTQRTDRTIATSERRHDALRTAASCRRFEPRAGLEAFVRGFVARRVEGPADSEYLSRFPATASCSLSWFLEGSAVRVCDEQSTQARIVFRGPQTQPVVVRHCGPLHMFILLLAPDALWWLTGARADCHLNRICPLSAALDYSWQTMALDVLHAPTDVLENTCARDSVARDHSPCLWAGPQDAARFLDRAACQRGSRNFSICFTRSSSVDA